MNEGTSPTRINQPWKENIQDNDAIKMKMASMRYTRNHIDNVFSYKHLVFLQPHRELAPFAIEFDTYRNKFSSSYLLLLYFSYVEQTPKIVVLVSDVKSCSLVIAISMENVRLNA